MLILILLSQKRVISHMTLLKNRLMILYQSEYNPENKNDL